MGFEYKVLFGLFFIGALVGCSNPSSPSSSSTANTVSVSFDGNLNTGGSVPTTLTGLSGSTVTVPGNTGTLVRTGYDFTRWNTSADGSGLSYPAGSSLVLGTINISLYAHWATGTASISVQLGTYGALSFTPSTLSLPIGQNLTFTPTASFSSGTNWQWYANGTQVGTSSTLSYTPSQPGFYTITAAVLYNGVAYSGSVGATVTQ